MANDRFNYLVWLQDLLDSTSDDYSDQYDPYRRVFGLDMFVIIFRYISFS